MSLFSSDSVAAAQKQGFDILIEGASDQIFDAAFALAEEELADSLKDKPYTAEFLASNALRVVADILAGIVSPFPTAQLEARSCLDQLLLGKESS